VITVKQVREVAESILEGSDKFLVDLALRPGNRITVYIDGDAGVTVDDCRDLSRMMESRLDRDAEDFELTVSSPGIDHPLKSERQYRKNIGRSLNVVTEDGETLEGVLVKAGNGEIELEHPVRKPKKEIKKQNTIISVSKIRTAKVVIKFAK
jgi:ribosome maturation factor RimP